jgi:hypothetical protein
MPPVSNNGPRTPTSLSMTDPYAPVKPKPPPPGQVVAPQDYRPKNADTFEEKKPQGPITATFEPSTGIQHTDGTLSPTAQHKDLPSDLKNKISQKVWEKLPQGQRTTLLASYQNFKSAGVWQFVDKVTGEKEGRERPVKIGCCNQTHVAGNSGGIQYELNNRKAFTDTLMAKNPEFGIDGGFMGAMHPGQTSIRESGPQSTSFHISVGPDNKMDAHIDQVNPVNTPDRATPSRSGLCSARH